MGGFFPAMVSFGPFSPKTKWSLLLVEDQMVGQVAAVRNVVGSVDGLTVRVWVDNIGGPRTGGASMNLAEGRSCHYGRGYSSLLCRTAVQ